VAFHLNANDAAVAVALVTYLEGRAAIVRKRRTPAPAPVTAAQLDTVRDEIIEKVDAVRDLVVDHITDHARAQITDRRFHW